MTRATKTDQEGGESLLSRALAHLAREAEPALPRLYRASPGAVLFSRVPQTGRRLIPAHPGPSLPSCPPHTSTCQVPAVLCSPGSPGSCQATLLCTYGLRPSQPAQQSPCLIPPMNNCSSDSTPCPPPVISYQKLGGAASRAHGGAVQVEDWGGCPEGRGSELSEGQQSGGQPGGELGLLNLKKKNNHRSRCSRCMTLWSSFLRDPL